MRTPNHQAEPHGLRHAVGLPGGSPTARSPGRGHQGRRLRTSSGWLAVARAGAVPCRAAGEVGAHRKEVIPGRTRPGQVMQALYYDRGSNPRRADYEKYGFVHRTR